MNRPPTTRQIYTKALCELAWAVALALVVIGLWAGLRIAGRG